MVHGLRASSRAVPAGRGTRHGVRRRGPGSPRAARRRCGAGVLRDHLHRFVRDAAAPRDPRGLSGRRRESGAREPVSMCGSPAGRERSEHQTREPFRRIVAGAVSDVEGDSGSRPIYSIGAVAAMLGVETATLRAWEERYGVVVPTRSGGAQRIYSRDGLERLRFVVDAVNAGGTPADAHRLLAERLRDTAGLSHPDPQGVTIVVLLAERDRYAAELFEYFLRTEGYEVCSAFDPTDAEDLFTERRPDLSIVDLMIGGGGLALCRRLAGNGGHPVLAMSALKLADAALAAGASAFLSKPVVPLQFVSTVRDLLGRSALTRRAAVS